MIHATGICPFCGTMSQWELTDDVVVDVSAGETNIRRYPQDCTECKNTVTLEIVITAGTVLQ